MSNQPRPDTVVGELPGGTKFIAASIATGRKELTKVDTNVENQSRFDHQSRVNLRHSVVEVTPEIYLDYVASQVMEWSDSEIEALSRTAQEGEEKNLPPGIIASIGAKFERLDFPLPDEVILVKTSGLEEGYAAYTRQMNVIALPANFVNSLESGDSVSDPLHPAQSQTFLENVIIHELFHIFSKNNEARRFKLYDQVHYHSTGDAVQLPDTPWGPPGTGCAMRDLKITNPDTPELNVYIEMEAPQGSGKREPLLPVLLASGPYEGGIFFEYMKWWFMVIRQNDKDNWEPKMVDGEPVLFDSNSLMEQYLNLVGNNVSGELFHPDEIMAMSFVLVANQPEMGRLMAINEVLVHP